MNQVLKGGSLTGKGFDCRHCDYFADTSSHGPGDRIMYAAQIGTEHMRKVHGMTLDGKSLHVEPVQLDIFDVLGSVA